MLRSPWLGLFAITIAGVIGYMLSEASGSLAIESVTVTIKATRETGAGWDFGGGAPDPKIRVVQGDIELASCPEQKDELKPTCKVGREIDREKGAVRVIVVDADSSDDDAVGEAVLDLDHGTSAGKGAIEAVDVTTRGAGSPLQRFRALWIALAMGFALAIALAMYRRRRA